MRSKQYLTSIKNNPHEISTDPSYFVSAGGVSKAINGFKTSLTPGGEG